MRSTTFLLTLVALGSSTAARAQGIIGKVLSESGDPVVAADVQLIDTNGNTRARSVTDTAGLFRLVAPLPGKYSVRAGSIGYATTNTSVAQLDKGVELNIEVRVSTQAVAVQPLHVVAERKYRVGRLGEYYDRAEWTRKTGFGHVLMRDDLDRMQGMRTTSILQTNTFPGRCRSTILLDGLEVHPEDFNSLDSMIPADQIEGIEIYRGATEIPIEYQTRAGCGLVMIWTRHDVPNGKPFGWKRFLIAAGLVGGIVLLRH